ncbi:MAG: 6-bladed beta-propeller [Prevotellaceae bacterium]|jgi:hypothetical protein|nr:6-bladed beta-propeller [Prevotellaceae bacterium]
MKQILLLTACIIAVYGCSIKEEDGTLKKSKTHKTIKFDLKQKPVSIHKTGLIKSMDIISLHCEDVFDRMEKIIGYKNRIYIFDWEQTYSVYIFDTLGKHINTISRHGQGPEEYAQISDIDVDTVNSTLNILSRMDKKLLKFDLDGKRCLGVERTAMAFTKMYKIKDGYLGYVANDIWDKEKPYNVWQLSEKQEVKASFFEIDKTWHSKSFPGYTVFSCFKDKIYYITPMDFNIYSIKDGKVFVEYTFDFGDYTWPPHLKEYKAPNETFEYRHSKVYGFDNFQETDKWLITRFLHKGQYQIGIYDKIMDTACVAHIVDSPDGEYFIISFGEIVGIDETTIYAKLDAQWVKDAWVGKNQYVDFCPKHGEQIERLRKKFPVVSEEDNPYLLIYKIN